MNLLLMHKNEIAAIINNKEQIITIINEHLMPAHLSYPDPKEIGNWLKSRMMSPYRRTSNYLCSYFGLGHEQMCLKAFGLSLTDAYWIKNENCNESWEMVNFFDNHYSDDINQLVLFDNKKIEDCCSPDLSTNGKLEKTWRIINNKNCLLKKAEETDICAEALCCQIARGFPLVSCVEYNQVTLNNQTYSVCENFLKPGFEFVPAYYIYYSKQKPFYVSSYDFLLERCDFYKIPNVKPFLQSMLAFDYLIGNTDRHMGNFGFIRNMDTLEYIGPAPLFDNECSLVFETGGLKNPFGEDQISKFLRHYECIDIEFLKKSIPEILSKKEVKSEREELQSHLISRLEKLERYKEMYADHVLKKYSTERGNNYGDRG